MPCPSPVPVGVPGGWEALGTQLAAPQAARHARGTAYASVVSLQQENDYLQECLEAIQQDFVIFNREK